MKEPSPMPDAVIESVFSAHTRHEKCPECGHLLKVDASKAHRILREMYWLGLEGCYGFNLAGMFVGVEVDGYMHT